MLFQINSMHQIIGWILVFASLVICNEIARPENRYVISMRRHLTVIANKKVVDIWDCSKEVVGVYWTRP